MSVDKSELETRVDQLEKVLDRLIDQVDTLTELFRELNEELGTVTYSNQTSNDAQATRR